MQVFAIIVLMMLLPVYCQTEHEMNPYWFVPFYVALSVFMRDLFLGTRKATDYALAKASENYRNVYMARRSWNLVRWIFVNMAVAVIAWPLGLVFIETLDPVYLPAYALINAAIAYPFVAFYSHLLKISRL